jgi:hypothetical protein
MSGDHRAAWQTALAACVLWIACAASPVHAQGLVGDLEVATEPGEATVYVAGRRAGVSPCVLKDVGVGMVEVVAEKEGFGRTARTVEVTPGGVTRVELELPRLENVGHLVVEVEPDGAAVEVNRVPRGETPLRLINLPAGTHRLRVAREGYLPMVTDVVIVRGRDNVVRGRLTQGFIEPGGPGGPLRPEDIVDPVRSPDDAPRVADMPEERAFQEVREWLRQRRYDRALEVLQRMAGEPEFQRYMPRITRDRSYIERARDVVQAGYEGLRNQIGRQYSLRLTGGIAMTGTVLDVGEEHVTVSLDGGEPTQIPLARIQIDRITLLAAPRFRPDDPANQVLFAVMNAMEGSFREAYLALRRAAEDGADVTRAKGYVDSERLWQAALDRQRREEAARAAEKPDIAPPARPETREPAVTGLVLVDRYRGAFADMRVRGDLIDAGFEVRDLNEPPSQALLRGASVLIMIDPGPERFVPPFDTAEQQLIAGFVQSGGGLLVIGSSRVRRTLRGMQPVDSPFSALLRPLRIDVRRVLEHLGEGAVAVGRLGERRLLALHRVLDHRGVDDVDVLALQRLDRLEEQLERGPLGLGHLVTDGGRRGAGRW